MCGANTSPVFSVDIDCLFEEYRFKMGDYIIDGNVEKFWSDKLIEMDNLIDEREDKPAYGYEYLGPINRVFSDSSDDGLVGYNWQSKIKSCDCKDKENFGVVPSNFYPSE